MFDTGQIKSLEDRKSALLVRSAANRRRLVSEAERLKPAVQWVDVGIAWSRKIRAGYSVLGPLLDALWHPSPTGGLGSIFQRIRGVLSIAKSVSAFWSQRR